MKRIFVFPEDHKIFSIQKLKEQGFSQYKISKLVDDRKLIKLNKSYYESTGYRGEELDFYYVKVYALNGLICLLSAAVYYNIMACIPDAIGVAIPRKAQISIFWIGSG